MSCRLPPVPQISTYGFVSLFLILGFDFFRPFEGANQPKKQHCNWGCGELLDYKGLNNSSIYGISGHSPLLRPRLSGFPKLAAGCIWWWLVWFDRGQTHLLLSDTWLYVFIHSNMARNAAKNALGIFAPFILSPTCNRNRPKPILLSYAQLCCGPQLHLETPPLPRSAAWLEAAALVAPDCISGCICFPFPYPNCHQLRPTATNWCPCLLWCFRRSSFGMLSQNFVLFCYVTQTLFLAQNLHHQKVLTRPFHLSDPGCWLQAPAFQLPYLCQLHRAKASEPECDGDMGEPREPGWHLPTSCLCRHWRSLRTNKYWV